MSKILVDTMLYNPNVAVLKINEENKTVDVFVRKQNKVITAKLITSKGNKEETYFRIGKRTFWTNFLYSFNNMNDNDPNKKELQWELYDYKNSVDK